MEITGEAVAYFFVGLTILGLIISVAVLATKKKSCPKCATCKNGTCPDCKVCPECKKCPTCPECKVCPPSKTCPECKVCPKCPSTPTQGGYALKNHWNGIDMNPSTNSDWVWFGPGDPTDGAVVYVTDATAAKANLIGPGSKPNSGKIIVGDLADPQHRYAARIVSSAMYDHGLFILDLNHMPEGLGTWPAWWLLGAVSGAEKWSCHGEIDIIEGVNSIGPDSSMNQSTLHTNKGCMQDGLDGVVFPDCNQTDQPQWKSCGCSGTDQCPTKGCGVPLKDPTSFGDGFNNKGGVYACELTKDGAVTIWYWARGDEPSDLLSDSPDPSKWVAKTVNGRSNKTSFKACPGFFANMQITLNTTLCGQWAGQTFPCGNGQTGCTPSSWAACNAAILAPGGVDKAYWDINWLRVYGK